jgi:hypothetical protein
MDMHCGDEVIRIDAQSSAARAAVAHEDLVDRRATVLQQPAFGNESRRASGGVSAAAEAEDKDLVARGIVLHRPFVCVGDSGIDAGAKHAAADAVAEFGVEAGRVIRALVVAIAAFRRDQRAETPDVGRCR